MRPKEHTCVWCGAWPIRAHEPRCWSCGHENPLGPPCAHAVTWERWRPDGSTWLQCLACGAEVQTTEQEEVSP